MGNSSLVRSSLDIGKGMINNNNAHSFASNANSGAYVAGIKASSNRSSNDYSTSSPPPPSPISSDVKLYQTLNNEEFEKVAHVLRKSLMDGLVTLPGGLTSSEFRQMEANYYSSTSSPPPESPSSAISPLHQAQEGKKRNNSLGSNNNSKSFRFSSRNPRLKDIKGTYSSESILSTNTNTNYYNYNHNNMNNIHQGELEGMNRFKLPPIDGSHQHEHKHHDKKHPKSNKDHQETPHHNDEEQKSHSKFPSSPSNGNHQSTPIIENNVNNNATNNTSQSLKLKTIPNQSDDHKTIKSQLSTNDLEITSESFTNNLPSNTITSPVTPPITLQNANDHTMIESGAVSQPPQLKHDSSNEELEVLHCPHHNHQHQQQDDIK